ncbi:PREDICTED: histone-lysine N-methyltransferase, H3 lysine-79 specific isoform X1 [Acromyrmex echinatior]|uniref:histone-lysine N-methyltransferase, H3 lysine-79 specific isoform X1 n=1 Tax=Acromyrmex echinatior TaxID=103372 RepID=UPI000580CE06|nr:PREDICTED: histone-lysine N-methyltransferase, H3 lysine-79 specific isoform X1 [Acromyrmex echinatior]XP_011069134.1 PREDICTED: histone-lysine N-methyltransferase, H3 lysine-79 specific isoform X1 [Acromyrmex echinatior]XP_011069135.1 PREDICTED: histone-lysine N-methyltransferase, H3 lysine-79 specific isoform X1 [Acromyrmex echinatior]
MIGRTSLLEQKRLQWAKEREEMARLGVNWGTLKSNSNYNRTHIRTYSNEVRLSLGELKDRSPVQPFRTVGHYGSTISLKSLATDSSGNGNNNLKCLDYNGGSLINLRDQVETSQVRHRSPSLPPIFNKEQQQYFCQLEQQQRDFGVEGSRYQSQRAQKLEHHCHRSNEHRENQKETRHYGSPGEEREGETSGYASDSVDVPQAGQRVLPDKAAIRMEMTEKTWQNPYCTTPESSLPPSRRLSPGKMGELNRPRWGGVWGQDAARGDPPPPSWLSRLGQSSQVLVINHDSASSPDSSTTGSTGSDINKVSYLRGQNIPMDAEILQEREMKRQKALELQNAIKQQLEEKDRQRKEEKERRLREEMLEEERIRRERERDKARFEEEQRIIREKEEAKLRKTQAMREVLEAAERLAKEDGKNRRKREEHTDEDTDVVTQFSNESKTIANISDKREEESCSQEQSASLINHPEEKSSLKAQETDNCRESGNDKNPREICPRKNYADKSAKTMLALNVSKDVAIVLSGRLEDPEILSRANLQLVNLVMTPSPRKFAESAADYFSLGLNTIMRNNTSPRNPRRSSRDASSTVVENRLLTPSKYRMPAGRDFGTQTDVESDVQELREKLQDQSVGDQGTMKERKDTTNANRRNVENSIIRLMIVKTLYREMSADSREENTQSNNMGPGEEIPVKTLPRAKSQPRTTLDSRPRWNANRPGTRYRTQSEKDPHYQRRLRLRRRQIESSDEGSRSPSPDRRKSNNGKSKSRSTIRRKAKPENYDADLSMDSLNSVVPLRIDKNGKINIENHAEKSRSGNDMSHTKKTDEDSSNIWCGQEILSKLSSLRSGLLMKQIEWDSERCLVSPTASEIF